MGSSMRGLGHLVTICAIGVACSSGSMGTNDWANSHDAGSPDIDASKRLTELTTAERITLCDWFAAMAGGYGAGTTTHCGVSTANISAGQSQSACVSDLSNYRASCLMTVHAFEGYVQSLFEHPCTFDPPADYKAASASCED